MIGCLPNVKNPFQKGNIDIKDDFAVLITEYSHSKRRKYCVRISTSS